MNKSIRKTMGVMFILMFVWISQTQAMAASIQERVTLQNTYLILANNIKLDIKAGQTVILQSIVDNNYAIVSCGNNRGSMPRKDLQYPKMYVYRENLNLRESPVNGKIITTMLVSSKVSVIAKEDGWAKVTYQGKTGYCSLSYLCSEHIIGSYSTKLSNNANNVNNIRVASNFINGKVVKAGSTFSYLDAIGGESTRELGYLPATVIINGEKTTGMGGGVCQVSSTLYAAIKDISDTNLIKVTERYPHSIPVGYIPRELEATIAYPTKDLKFVPSCDIQIESYLQDGWVYVNIIQI